MRYLFFPALLLGVSAAAAAMPLTQAYPGCDISAQRVIPGETADHLPDPREAHISVRVNILQADISNARRARHLTQPQADMMWSQADRIRGDAIHFVEEQGFLSAAESAVYDSTLDDIASRLCQAVSRPGA